MDKYILQLCCTIKNIYSTVSNGNTRARVRAREGKEFGGLWIGKLGFFDVLKCEGKKWRIPA